MAQQSIVDMFTRGTTASKKRKAPDHEPNPESPTKELASAEASEAKSRKRLKRMPKEEKPEPTVTVEKMEEETQLSAPVSTPSAPTTPSQPHVTKEVPQPAAEKSKEKPKTEKENDEVASSAVDVKSGSSGLRFTAKAKGAGANGEVVLPANFDPIRDAMWKHGEKAPYLALARTFSQIEKVSSRLAIIELLTNLLRSIIALSPDDLLPCVYLCVNKIAPAYQGLELGVGESLLMKAVADATGKTLASVKSSYDEVGDLGLIAQNSRNTQRTMLPPPPLTIYGVFRTLKSIAQETGHASMKAKIDRIKSLLVSCRECEAQFIIRSLEGKLRIGLAEKSVLVALGHAIVLTPPSQQFPPAVLDARRSRPSTEIAEQLVRAVDTIKQVYSELPNYEIIIPALLGTAEDDPHEDPIARLRRKCHLMPGVPVAPMLAQPTKGIAEVLQRFAEKSFTCEFKYDGERAQIHRTDDGKITVYSRNLEDNTGKYPDILNNLPRAINTEFSDPAIPGPPGVRSFILDNEAVAIDPATGKLRPFQILSTRARKTVALADIKVPVSLFAFDLLYLNGRPLLSEPLSERRRLLRAAFKEIPGEFGFAKSIDSMDVEDINGFLTQAIEGGCEGLMVKMLTGAEAAYEPSKRSYNWLKVKKDYLAGLTDTFDLVPIAAYYGKGKRTGAFGAYLLACWDDEAEEYQSICKIGTGFSDQQLAEFAAFFRADNRISDKPKPYYRYGGGPNLEPDVWFEPCVVWEIVAADLTLSPVHKAAIGLADPAKGIALRFPRFIRVREDKTPEQATTGMQVYQMFKNQKQISANPGGEAAAEEED